MNRDTTEESLVKKLQEEFKLDGQFAKFLGKILIEEKENYKDYVHWFSLMEFLFKTSAQNAIIEKVKHFAPNKALHVRANASLQIIKNITNIAKLHTTNNEDKKLVDKTIKE